MTALAPVLQAFFTDRLIAQRRASPHTIAGYRDTFRLLVRFATTTTGKTPSALDITDLDAPLITAFLDHLEVDRHNAVRTRNWAWTIVRACRWSRRVGLTAVVRRVAIASGGWATSTPGLRPGSGLMPMTGWPSRYLATLATSPS